MAYDDIVKALTIQISADDLTGGAWSSVGKGVKDVWNNVTALNQAWELGAKAYNMLAGAMDQPIAILSAGGAYAEAKAGFQALAESYRVDGDKIVNSIRDISLGSAGLMEATQAASNAIKKGFSSDQITLMAQFAKKYTDTVGGEFLTVLADIEKSIATGNLKAAKTYDLPIAKGMEWIEVQKILETKLKSMGEGAFNFGDEWEGITESIKNAYLEIYKGLNDLTGEAGFSSIAQTFRETMRGIEDNAATIASGIFYIIRDMVVAVARPISTAFELFSEFFDMTFSEADDMGVKINTVIIGIGNTIYDTVLLASNLFNSVFFTLDKALSAGAGGFAKVISGMVKVNELTGFYSPENSAALKEYGLTLEEISKAGLFTIDIDEITKKQANFNKQIMEAGAVTKEASKEHKEMSKGLLKVGEAYEDMGKKAKASAKDVILSNEEINKYGGILFQANMLAQAGKAGTKEYNDLIAKSATGNPKATAANTPASSTGTTTQNAVSRSSQQVIKIEVQGKDGAMKELIEEIIERVTTKAVAEGLITAGV